MTTTTATHADETAPTMPPWRALKSAFGNWGIVNENDVPIVPHNSRTREPDAKLMARAPYLLRDAQMLLHALKRLHDQHVRAGRDFEAAGEAERVIKLVEGNL